MKKNQPEDTTKLEMDIVSDTFRSIVDQKAFDDLILSWNAKLNASEDMDGPNSPAGWFSSAFLRQLDSAQATLSSLDIPVGNDPLERLISEVAGPSIVLGPDLRVVSVNEQGSESFATRVGAFFDTERIDPTSIREFEALVRTANNRGNMAQCVLHVSGKARENEQFHAEAFVVQRPNQSRSHIAIRTLQLPWSESAAERMEQAFGLSATEVEVGRQFFECCNLAEVARLRNVSLHTVRTQIKSIQAKTGAPSQAELIRLFAMVASRQLLDTRGVSTAWKDPMGREQVFTAKDGRKIAWTWIGAEDGTPAVMLRGMGMGYLLPRHADGRLAEAGVKLLALSRPGYGNTTMREELPVLEDNLECLQAFMSELALKGCVGIGLSDGIVPLLGAQDRDPSQFSALLSVGFNGVLNRTAVRRLPIAQSTLLRLARYAPGILDLIAQLGYRMMQRYGLDWYLDRAHATCEIDLCTSRDPATIALVRDACAHLAVQGTQPFVREMQLFHAPVDRAIDRLSIPMTSLVPTEDGLFDLDEYLRLEKRNNLVTVVPVPRSADLMIYQQTDLVLDHIIKVIHEHR